jgi:hypothetical protein
VTGGERIPHGSDRLKLASACKCVKARRRYTSAARIGMTPCWSAGRLSALESRCSWRVSDCAEAERPTSQTSGDAGGSASERSALVDHVARIAAWG